MEGALWECRVHGRSAEGGQGGVGLLLPLGRAGRHLPAFEKLEGIKSTYQFFMLKPGEVLMRIPACWCSACFDVAERGPSRGTALGSYYTATDCSRPGDELYE